MNQVPDDERGPQAAEQWSELSCFATCAHVSQNIGKRAGDQKVLLYKAQALPQTRGVARIKHASQGFGPEPFCHGADEISVAELLLNSSGAAAAQSLSVFTVLPP